MKIYIHIKKEKKALTSIVNNEQSVRGYYRICSHSFPSLVYPYEPGSNNAQYKVPSRQVISLREPLCRFGSIVVPQNSTIKNIVIINNDLRLHN